MIADNEGNMSTILFIRHGQASFGKENYDELSERGHHQSSLLARYFEDVNRRFDVIYTGTLERHLKTVEKQVSLLEEKKGPMPPVRRLEGLNEYPTQEIFPALAPFAVKANPALMDDVGKLMSDRKSFQKVFEAVMAVWTEGKHEVPGLVSWKEFIRRVNGAIDTIMEADGTGKTVAVYTSGGPISVVVQRTLHLSGDDTMRAAEQLVNTSFSRFKCTSEKIMMATFNEYPHLERENDEKLITYR
jgi:broad specificity phosphatase PhoE